MTFNCMSTVNISSVNDYIAVFVTSVGAVFQFYCNSIPLSYMTDESKLLFIVKLFLSNV